MKMMTLAAAGLLATGMVAASPADAQRGDWRDGARWDRGGNWDGYRGGWNGNRGWDRGDRWDRGNGWDRSRGWGRGYGRPRVTCRIVRGFYGPERRCFRAYR